MTISSCLAFEQVQSYYESLQSCDDRGANRFTKTDDSDPTIENFVKSCPVAVRSKLCNRSACLPLGIAGRRVLGRRVLGLGCSSGRDCYVCASLVGECGIVVGIDVAEESLAVAREHAEEYCRVWVTGERGKTNMSFVVGYMEYLDRAGLSDSSFDVVVSSGAVSLSPDLPRVLQEVYRVLDFGGEFHFSDIYSDRRLTDEERATQIEFFGQGVTSAMYVEDFIRVAMKAGFDDPRVLLKEDVQRLDPSLGKSDGDASFHRIVFRLFKLPGMLETKCEDYGQTAIYKGTIQGYVDHYDLDDHHTLEKGQPFRVCGNTAAMLGENMVSWLSPHFEIHGNRLKHYGLFDCGGDSASPCC